MPLSGLFANDSVIEPHEKGLVNDIFLKKMSEDHLKNSVTTNYANYTNKKKRETNNGLRKGSLEDLPIFVGLRQIEISASQAHEKHHLIVDKIVFESRQ